MTMLIVTLIAIPTGTAMVLGLLALIEIGIRKMFDYCWKRDTYKDLDDDEM